MKSFARAGTVAAAAVFATIAFNSTPTQAASIAISCGAVGAELELCRTGAEAWAKETGNEVVIVSTPNSSTERLALYQQILAAGGDDIDVYQIDVIWPGILGSHFIDLAPFMDGAQDAHFPAIVENNTIDGELKAMPWFTDAGVLYYRKDLLDKHGREVPQTWADLAETAKIVLDAERGEGNDRMNGIVFQGRAYEGLTCNALEWIDSYGGGAIVSEDGEVKFSWQIAVEPSGKMMARWQTATGIQVKQGIVLEASGQKPLTLPYSIPA